MKLRIPLLWLISAAMATVFGMCDLAAQVQPAATTTTLAITSGGNPVTTVSSGNLVTLTAAVESGATPVTVGQVNFCDAAAKSCTDVHIVGTAQLIQAGPNAGTAFYRFHPGIGNRSYQAVFAGTPRAAMPYAGSASSFTALTVTGKASSTTAINSSGSEGNYTVTATVGGMASIQPTGTVSFLDASNANAVVGTAMLSAGTQGLGVSNLGIPMPNLGANSEFFIAEGDFNGDGIPDLAAIDNQLVILLGNGDGTFRMGPSNPASGLSPVVADFNGDGVADLGLLGTDATVTILLGNGDGTFTAKAAGSATGTGPLFLSMVTADFNGDGIADLAVAGNPNYYEPSSPYLILILLGNGDGTFTAAGGPATTVANLSIPLVTGDFNGDGIPDLAVVDGTELRLLLGMGDGTFTAGPSTSVGYFHLSAAADFNEDGKLDLVGYDGAGVHVLLGNGDGTFTAGASPAPDGWDSAVGDFNGDGHADLAVLYRNGACELGDDIGVSEFLGNGQGVFRQANGPTNVLCPDATAVGDFNGDGLTDLATSGGTIGDPWPPSISVITSLLQETVSVTGISPLGTGTHQVEASYSGDSVWDSSVSATIPLTAESPSFAILGTAVTVAPGATTGNTSTISVTPAGGFTGSVALTAAVTSGPGGGTLPPTFSFGSTTPVNITGATAGTATLTITTTAGSTTTCPAVRQSPQRVSWLARGGLVLACAFLFGLPAGRRGRRSRLGTLVLLAALGGGLIACSGGGGGGKCVPTTTPGTTAGMYTITVTGTSGGLTETGTVALTVQ